MSAPERRRSQRKSAIVLLGAALLCGMACGETSRDESEPAGGASGGAQASTGGQGADASCPAETPTQGARCEGALSCSYYAFLGCFPSSVRATCREGRWDVPAPVPYSGPCPGDPIGEPPKCPEEPPQPGTPCMAIPTLEGPVLTLTCEYPEPACEGEGPLIATCNGQWQLTPCVADGVGGAGAGGEAAGGWSSGGAD